VRRLLSRKRFELSFTFVDRPAFRTSGGVMPLAGAAHVRSPHMTDSNVTTAATTKRPATSDDRSMVMMLGKREGLRGTGDKKVIGSATRYSCSSG
jgi:hypothetical protein